VEGELATKGTKSTKKDNAGLFVPFVLFVANSPFSERGYLCRVMHTVNRRILAAAALQTRLAVRPDHTVPARAEHSQSEAQPSRKLSKISSINLLRLET